MTNHNQKDLIVAYRDEGLSYKQVAERTGTTEQHCRTVYSRESRKEVINSIPEEGLCRTCGQPLIQESGVRKRYYCDVKCRNAYFNRRSMNKPYILVCDRCGSEFVSYGYPKKRYCSRDCRTLAERKG